MKRMQWIVGASFGLPLAVAGAAHAGGSSVTATLKGGALVVVGDDTASTLVIHATPQAGTLVIEGVAGELINGASSAEFAGVTRGITLDLGGGDDELLLTPQGQGVLDPELVVPALSVRSGEGDDLLVLERVRVAGKLAVDSGPGADAVVAFLSTLEGNARFASADGDDALVLVFNTSAARALRADLGAGNDVFGFDNGRLEGKTSLLFGTGDDLAGFSDIGFGATAKIDGGAGSDGVVQQGAGAALAAQKLKGFEGAIQNVNLSTFFALVLTPLPGFERAQVLANTYGIGLN